MGAQQDAAVYAYFCYFWLTFRTRGHLAQTLNIEVPVRRPQHDNADQLTAFDSDTPRAAQPPQRRHGSAGMASATELGPGQRRALTRTEAPSTHRRETRHTGATSDLREDAPSDLASSFVAALDDRALDTLAERLAPRLDPRLTPAAPRADEWLDARGAAAYLGLTLNALHKHTAARTIPFEQNIAGGKLWFKRDQLDAWRRGTT
jgi:hypothetical protein